MWLTVYIDVFFIVNALINYIILIVTAKICNVPTGCLRIVAAAVLGGVYSVLAVLKGYGYGFWDSPVIKISTGILMVIVAYGNERGLLRITTIFFSLSATFAGIVLAVSYMSGRKNTDWIYRPVSLKILLISFSVSYFVISFLYQRSCRSVIGGGISEVEAEINGKYTHFRALHDTGNSLSDPLSGDRVIVTDASVVKELFSKEMYDVITNKLLQKPVQAVQELYNKNNVYKFRLVPYRAVGVKSGFLLAVKPDKIYIDKKPCKNTLIALSPNKVSSGEDYSALMGGEKV